MGNSPEGGAAMDRDAQRYSEIASLNLRHVRFRSVFQTIVDLVCSSLDCPVSLLSVIDKSEQWFIAQRGLDVTSTPLSTSFCKLCVDLDGPELWVRDTRVDERIAETALATEQPCVRSYLGLPIKSPNGVIIGALCAIHTVPDAFTKRHLQQLENCVRLVEHTLLSHAQRRELESANTVFEQAERSAHIGSWMIDLHENTLHWSKETYRIHGHPLDARVDIESAIDFYLPEDRPKVRAAVEDVMRDKRCYEFEATIVTTDGHLRRVFSRGERIDRGGKPDRIVGVFHDITERHFQHLALQRAARYDRLTDLDNRASFDDELGRRTGRFFTASSYVGMIDLDGFKDVNAEHGHLIGDIILEEVSRRLKQFAPAGAFVARWGGDEFALLLPARCDRDEALRTATTLIERIAAPIKLPAIEIRLGATIGMSEIAAGLTSQEVVRRADLALYQGKKKGGNAALFYDKAIESNHSQRIVAIRSINAALDESRVFVGYQPIVELATGTVNGFEGLLRFFKREGGIATAGEVQPALLDPVTCRRIGTRVHDLVAHDLPGLLAASATPLRVGINVSEAELIEPDFAERFIATQEAAGLHMRNFVLEVTETMLIVNDVMSVRRTLERLVDAGAEIALDDFGTGFSSLSHLRDFPISKVKIDRSFVAQMTQVHQSRLIVQAILSMTRNLGIDAIAEGVETEAQARLLETMGCRFGQGFYFGHAIAADRAALDLGAFVNRRGKLRAVAATH